MAAPVAAPVARRRDPMPAPLLGVILFVASECVFFAALFGAYFTVRAAATNWPPEGIEESLKAWPISTIATSLLLLSSVTMQFGVGAIRRGDRATTLGFSIHDTVFGTTFFTMTGFHGAHVAGGLVFIYLILARGWAGQITRDDHSALEGCAIYWHFVDIVWVGLFSTLYLLK